MLSRDSINMLFTAHLGIGLMIYSLQRHKNSFAFFIIFLGSILPDVVSVILTLVKLEDIETLATYSTTVNNSDSHSIVSIFILILIWALVANYIKELNPGVNQDSLRISGSIAVLSHLFVDVISSEKIFVSPNGPHFSGMGYQDSFTNLFFIELSFLFLGWYFYYFTEITARNDHEGALIIFRSLLILISVQTVYYMLSSNLEGQSMRIIASIYLLFIVVGVSAVYVQNNNFLQLRIIMAIRNFQNH